MYAAQQNRIHCVRALVEAGANKETMDNVRGTTFNLFSFDNIVCLLFTYFSLFCTHTTQHGRTVMYFTQYPYKPEIAAYLKTAAVAPTTPSAAGAAARAGQ